MGVDEDGGMNSSGMDPFGHGMDSPFGDIFAQFAGGNVRFSTSNSGHSFAF